MEKRIRMKKIKSAEQKLREKGLLSELPGINDPDWFKKAMEEENRIKEEKKKEEQKRIDNLKCPCCKSTNKKHIVKSNDNGIFGPGYKSWVIEEYFTCLDCGVMFKDVEKQK